MKTKSVITIPSHAGEIMHLLPTFAQSHRDIEPLLNTINHCDAFELLARLPDNSIDMVFIDPPYGHNNNNNGDLIHRWEAALGQRQVTEDDKRPIANDGKEANELFKNILPELRRVLKTGSCCCCCGGGCGGPDPQFARWSLWLDEILEFKQMVVWDKGPMGMGWHYRRSYETVLVAQKRGAACKWYDDSHKIENIIRPNTLERNKIIPLMDNHPTEKPIGLAEHFIKLHSQVGDIVLDCFAGSGSTLQAAKKLSRNYIGCEIDIQYVNMARKRLQEADPYTFTELENGMKQRSLFETLESA